MDKAAAKRLTAKRLSQELVPLLAEAIREEGFTAAGAHLSRRKGEVELRIIPVVSASHHGGCRVEVYLHIHVDSVERLWRPHIRPDDEQRFGLSAYAVYFGGIAPSTLSSLLVSSENEIPRAVDNLARGLRQHGLPHLEALATPVKLRKRLDAERARDYALTVRDICVYLILLALEGRQDEIRALATELMKPLKKQFAGAARKEIERSIEKLTAALTTAS
jgi:hypothetical protein